MVRRIGTELGTAPIVIATGGLSHLMVSVCETLDHHEPDLTLIGLRLVFEKNQD
jgi:type III pantothenate kinase